MGSGNRSPIYPLLQYHNPADHDHIGGTDRTVFPTALGTSQFLSLEILKMFRVLTDVTETPYLHDLQQMNHIGKHSTCTPQGKNVAMVGLTTMPESKPTILTI
jgi:hypothetical protein